MHHIGPVPFHRTLTDRKTIANLQARIPFRRQLQHLNVDHFARLSAFLRNSAWESTNNAAERGGHAFRHGQHPHFRLRSAKTVNRSVIAVWPVEARLGLSRIMTPGGSVPPERLSASISVL